MFKIGEKVVVALSIEVWRSDANNHIPNINIGVGEEVIITNIREDGNIEINKVEPKYGSFLPCYFRKLEK